MGAGESCILNLLEKKRRETGQRPARAQKNAATFSRHRKKGGEGERKSAHPPSLRPEKKRTENTGTKRGKG